VISRHRYHRAEFPRIPQKYSRTLKFSGPRPLRKITRCRYGIERAFGNRPLDCVDLLQHRRPAEMQIRNVQNRRHSGPGDLIDW
jgi:hypothetical protein